MAIAPHQTKRTKHVTSAGSYGSNSGACAFEMVSGLENAFQSARQDTVITSINSDPTLPSAKKFQAYLSFGSKQFTIQVVTFAARAVGYGKDLTCAGETASGHRATAKTNPVVPAKRLHGKSYRDRILTTARPPFRRIESESEQYLPCRSTTG